MNECVHSWLTTGSSLQLVKTLDDWLGPTLAIVQCSDCGQPALLNLVAWQGEQLRSRIFGVRELPRAATDTYLANINRDYCDLTRKTSETEALIQTAGPAARLLRVSLPELVIEAISASPVNAPFRDWQAISADDFGEWQKKLPSDETN